MEAKEKTPLISDQGTLPEATKQLKRWPRPVSLLLQFRGKYILAVEPVVFLFMFGTFLQLSLYQQYAYNRYAQDLFREELNWTGGFNFCMNADIVDSYLGNGTKASLLITQKASYVSLANSITGQLPGIFASILYGSLSDRIGRKPLLIVIGIAGIANSVLTIVLMFAKWPVEILPAISAINGLAGGLPGMLTLVFAYTADITSQRWLTLRLALLESMIFIGGSLALLINGQWLNATNCMFPGPEYLYLGSSVALIVYTIVWLPESLSPQERRERRQNVSTWKVATRGLKLYISKEYSRWKIWLGTASLFIGYFLAVGIGDISTFFLIGPPLSWNPSLIGLYQAMIQGAYGIALFTLVPIMTALKVPDPLIILLGFGWAAATSVATTFVRVTWQMFLVGAVSGVGIIGFPPIRSIMSKAVDPKDQGAMFSMVAAFQVLSSACAATFFFFLLPYTTLNLGWPAGNIYFFIAFFCVLIWPLAIVFLVVNRCTRSQSSSEEQDVPETAVTSLVDTDNYTGKTHQIN